MKIHPVAAAISPLLAGSLLFTIMPIAWGRDYFDPALLALGGDQATVTDLSSFETAGNIPPGTYLVTLFVNQQEHGQYSIVFNGKAEGEAKPELTPAFLEKAGVNTPALPAFAGLPKDKPVGDLVALLPDARIYFNFPKLRLELSIPQAAMKPNARGTVDPALWDNGVPALLLNYSLNAGRNHQDEQGEVARSEQTNLYGNLRGGLNWQAWRLRSDMIWTRNENKTGHGRKERYQNTSFSNTFVQRDIRPWRAEILAGESNTGNDVFDTIPFRGIKFNSSDEMRPASLRGFAPLITGIAQSNARVTVSQNGNVVYQTYVAPGPFRIDDLYQTGQGGNLTVTVTEADGSVRTWTQAFSSLPVMQRPGGLKYELTAGRYHGGVTRGSREADFVLGTLIYGFPHNVTLYGGTLMAKDYNAFSLGSGISLGNFGALSADFTTSSATMDDGPRRSGQSYRLRYAKSLLSTGTSVDLTAYRYSTRHYYNFADFNNSGYRPGDDQVPWALARQRSEFQMRLSQQLGRYGSLYLSGSRSEYWTGQQENTTLSAGYNGSWRSVNIGLAYSIDRIKSDGHWPQNRQLALNIQVPFSLFSPAQAVSHSYASYQMTHSNKGEVRQQAGVNGSSMDDRLSWSLTQGLTNGDDSRGSSTSTMNLGWQGSKGMASMGYSRSSHYNALNLNGAGGVVVHPEGITLGQQLGNSVAVVRAPAAGDVRVMNGNVRTNGRGYAVVPYLSSYQNNTVNLDPSTLPEDVDLTQSSVNVYPTKGAVVMANFATRTGYQVLFTLTHADAPVPFGATVTTENRENSHDGGIVGDAGQVYLNGLPEQGWLKAVWGQEAAQQCRARFNLAGVAISKNNPVRMLKVRCEDK